MTTPAYVGLMVLAIILCLGEHVAETKDTEQGSFTCNKALDIGIIIDGSTSIYKRNFDKVKDFFQALTTSFTVSPQGTHFGVIVFSTNAHIEFNMADGRYHQPKALVDRIQEIRYPLGWTRTDKALELASKELFTSAAGDRSDKQNVLILFTDGKTNKGGKPFSQILPALKAKRVQIIAIGVGKDISREELVTIAMGKQENVITIEDFDGLQKKLTALVQQSCKTPPSTSVNGDYSSWTDWATCTKTCGGGTSTRSRTCTNPKPENEGKDCSGLGPAKESKACGSKPCAVDGNYSKWSGWATCTKTCGGGTNTRSRTCTNPKPENGGKDCSGLGPAKESQSCGMKPCPVDGNYTSWTDWTPCTKSCGGGTTSRSRKCTNPKPENGGKGCSRLGHAENSKACKQQSCPSECGQALGLQSNTISDSQMSASSEWNVGHRAANARLHFHAGAGRTGAWSARYNNADQWLQVDLKVITKITKIATQGRQDADQWVTKYSVSYSRDGVFWKDYPDVFPGNTDRGTVVSLELERAIYARFVRILPQAWHKHISLRAEVYGCFSGLEVPSETCITALGMQNKGIRDARITASSMWNGNNSPARARLGTAKVGHFKGAWSARTNDQGQWIQVHLDQITKVTRIATQGRQDANQWVRSYALQFSLDGGFFENYNDGQVLRGNTDRNSIVGNVLDPAIIAQYIRILPKSWNGHISMRFEVYGCKKGFQIPNARPCAKDLAMSKSQLSASSEWNKNHGAANARLQHQVGGGRTGAWSARYNNVNQWLQVDLRKIAKVTRIATQGRADANQWVKTYTIEYSLAGTDFVPYKVGGNEKVFLANEDRYTVKSHQLSNPIYARYIRIRPKSWNGHISMRMALYGCSSGFRLPVTKCGQALGLQSNAISDSQMSASSEWNVGHRAANARLHFHAGAGRTGAWSARYNNADQWLQVDLKVITKITKIATQGRQDADQWVTKYSFSYSRDGVFWKDYPDVFPGNTDRGTVVSLELERAIYARFVRILPQAWHKHISLRAEVYGCFSGLEVPSETCITALGMQNKGIRDARITASSMWNGNNSPARARLGTAKVGHFKGAWSARTNDQGQWIQVHLDQITKVTRIATQGRQDANQWVRSYALQFSLDGGFFENYNDGQVLRGNTDRNSIVGNVLDPAIIAQYIRILPKSWNGHISMRFEVYGCKKGFQIPNARPCAKDLAMSKSQLSASSEWNKNHGAANARLQHQVGGGRTGAWSARYNNVNQWLQVDLRKIAKVTRIATQGRADANQWVKTYTIEYSLAGTDFVPYKVGGNEKVFLANEDRYTVKSHQLSNPIYARYIRIRPKSWNGHISMRMALYGCSSGFRLPVTKCGQALGLQSNAISDSQMSASSEWNVGHRAANARLHFHAGAGRTGAWSARYNNADQWLQVDLKVITKITKIATQGRQDADQWVTKYSFSYSRDGVFWKDYPDVFPGNTDRGTVVSLELERAIYARFVRILPQAWHKHISLRAEVYGCFSGLEVPSETCITALGMQNKGIRDARITASSMWNGNNSPARARLGTAKVGHFKGAWSARTNDQGQWIQVHLDQITKVTRIATQGRQDANQWVRSYALQFSLDGGFFENYNDGQVLRGNTDRNSIVGNVLDPAIIAQYIRILPKSWNGHISMRFEVYGCKNGFRIPEVSSCGRQIYLGDWMMSSSSDWNYNHRAANAKLDFFGGGGRTGAWSARYNNVNQWLLVDFVRQMKLTRISTQGRHDRNQWVKSYSLEYSLNGVKFTPYKVNGVVKILNGNSDRYSVVGHKLPIPIVAEYVRIRPLTWYGHVSMRVGMYGCPTGKGPSTPPCRQSMDVGVIMDRSGSIGTENFRRSQDFVVRLISHIKNASPGSRFGVIAYNSIARRIFKFSDAVVQSSFKTLIHYVYGIKYSRGGTRTDRALILANTALYSPQGGYRNNLPNVLFVLTDGKTNRGSKPYSIVLRPLLNKKVKVIAVGIGKGINDRELRQISSKHVFQVKDYASLSKNLKNILDASCP